MPPEIAESDPISLLPKRKLRRNLLLLFLGVVLYFLLTKFGATKQSIGMLARLNIPFVILAVAALGTGGDVAEVSLQQGEPLENALRGSNASVSARATVCFDSFAWFRGRAERRPDTADQSRPPGASPGALPGRPALKVFQTEQLAIRH